MNVSTLGFGEIKAAATTLALLPWYPTWEEKKRVFPLKKDPLGTMGGSYPTPTLLVPFRFSILYIMDKRQLA